MSKDIVAFCLEFGLNEKSELIQSFDGEPMFVLGWLISSFRRNPASDFNNAFIILKNFYATHKGKFANYESNFDSLYKGATNVQRQREIGAQLIGRTLNAILKNEPTIFNQLNNALAQKEEIAKRMFGYKGGKRISEEKIFEWLKHMQAGLLKAKFIYARRL